MYELFNSLLGDLANAVKRLSDNAFIPFDPSNADYKKFKQDVLDGASLIDAKGNVMSKVSADAFVLELP